MVAYLYLSRDILVSITLPPYINHVTCVLTLVAMAGHYLPRNDPSSLFGNLSDSAAIIVNIERLTSNVGSALLKNICVFNIL